MVSLLYEFLCVSLGYLTERKIVHSWNSEKVSCRSESVCVSSSCWTGRKTCHKHYRRMVSLHYGFLHGTSVYLEFGRLSDRLDSCGSWSTVVWGVLAGEQVK